MKEGEVGEGAIWRESLMVEGILFGKGIRGLPFYGEFLEVSLGFA